MPDTQILASGSAGAPEAYTVPPSQEIILKVVSCTLDGTGASGNFYPMVSIIPPGGVGPVECPMLTSIAAGESAEVSWFQGGLASQEATAVFWLPADLLWGAQTGQDPDTNLAAVGAVQLLSSTAYYQNPAGTPFDALSQNGQGPSIQGNILAEVKDATAWGDTEEFAAVLSYSAGTDFEGTGPYVEHGQCVGGGYVVKSAGTSFTPFTLIAGDSPGIFSLAASARMYLADGTIVGPTNPFTLANGDIISCFWVTAVGAWD